ncbi:sugar phosphate isomerase/epimerase family protein [Tunicatimonas pelagia]|uniref:sugar phosphate isomerase/epimerase family protein n=1 Tax=Tunicatimonas pelagia TaxID=931531 RepID=UPI00266616A3|nr:sugar phosphate isomerase/epimerase family protein [Tunicatimonas pelagia]WKN43400.1 sugar phosphate isomerase/epimerase [Tunicatimonas pelagia]
MNRRHFLQQSTLAAATLASTTFTSSASPQLKTRKFTMSLDTGAIGVKADQSQLIDYAAQYGFEAVTPISDFLAKLSDGERSTLLENMQQKNIGWGVAGLPVEFRKDEDTLRDGLSKLPALAKGLQQANVTRVSTWIMPTHAELNYLKNLRQHTNRLREVAKILADYDLRFGLEYVGPTTLRHAKKYAFVHTLEETQALIEEIGQKNVGVVLDSFHWFTAQEDVKDILTLSNEDVVAGDLNDAHAGRSAVEQIDGERELPMATGLIDTQAFLDALVTIGFDGPVRAEPFNQTLRDMPDDKAVASTAEAMKKAFDLVG